MTLLSKTEVAFLSGSRQFSKGHARVIRSRLNKKLRTLNVELSQLQGVVTDSSNCSVTENCNGSVVVAAVRLGDLVA